jgi:hypothetical protein
MSRVAHRSSRTSVPFALGALVVLVGVGIVVISRDGAMLGTAFLLLAVGGRMVFRFFEKPLRGAEPPDLDDPRWLPSLAEPQVVGRTCASCGRRITVTFEGAACSTCQAPCHASCVEQHRLHEHRPAAEAPYR